MKNFFFTLLASFLLLAAKAQPPSSPTSGDIYLGIRKLNVLGSVLYVAAHPDDENTRLLTYFSKDKLYRTGYLSLTRGDGGQNLIGDEQGIELGLIRTQELLSARRIDGAEQFFTRAYDFGFSKSPEETFTKWDKEKILSDVVWVIRKFQPDVIITRFPTTGEGGHGHHTASAIVANEAFIAAADAKRFPEQLKWVQPWQAKRILWNAFNFGGNNTTSPDQFQLDAGGFNPVLGKSYGEIAADSRSQHKSQGFGVPKTRGEAIENFRATGGGQPANDLFEDVTTGWKKIQGAEKVEALVQAAIASFDFLLPQKSVPQLAQIHSALQAMPAGYWRDRKLVEVKDLIESASGVWMETYANLPYAVQGDSVRFNFVFNDRLGAGITVEKVTVDAFDTSITANLFKNKNYLFNKTVFVPVDKDITQPYWLKEKMNEGYFEVSDQGLIGQPDVQPAYTATYSLLIAGQRYSFTKPVRYKFTDPVKGEIYQPVYVIPAATVAASPSTLLFKKGLREAKVVDVQVNANKALSGAAAPHIKSLNYDTTTRDVSFALAAKSSKQYSFVLNSDRSNGRSVDNLYGSVQYTDHNKEAVAYLTMRGIDYDHIPSIRYFYGDAIKTLWLDLKTEGKKIGYIVGAGDKVPEALAQMGYEVTVLNARELSKNKLKDFDAIISGVRAYNTNDWLNSYHDKLMKYVEEGGNLIVQYNTSSNAGPVRAKIGPYNFNISRARITDENAAVSFLRPEHPVLNFPNKITNDDFKGWIQERSIYHADNLDSHYESILRMNDPGEAPHDGSLIVTKYGKGFFTYTGLVFFRELPAGVPGAYRLLANLIALNKIKGS